VDGDGQRRFAAWSAAQAPSLHRFAYLMCGDWHDAEDLVQESLARAALHWSRIERAEHPDAYVRTILVNQCRSMWRRPWSRAVPSAERADRAVPDATESIATRSEVMQALRLLPVRQRATVVLRYYEELSEAETAAVLGCSVGTVKNQTHKALRTLRETMAKEALQC
jgi:RNA polymerase sigma-70 factor (sigma-E family)